MSLSNVKAMKENFLWNQNIHNWIHEPIEGKLKLEILLIFMVLLDRLLFLSMGSDLHLFPSATVSTWQPWLWKNIRKSCARAQESVIAMNLGIYQNELNNICKIIFWGQLCTGGERSIWYYFFFILSYPTLFYLLYSVKIIGWYRQKA